LEGFSWKEVKAQERTKKKSATFSTGSDQITETPKKSFKPSAIPVVESEIKGAQ